MIISKKNKQPNSTSYLNTEPNIITFGINIITSRSHFGLVTFYYCSFLEQIMYLDIQLFSLSGLSLPFQSSTYCSFVKYSILKLLIQKNGFLFVKSKKTDTLKNQGNHYNLYKCYYQFTGRIIFNDVS